MDWFLYDNGLHHERLNNQVSKVANSLRLEEVSTVEVSEIK